MPKTRQQKEAIVSELASTFRQMKSAIFTAISGYTMEDADALRKKGREQGVAFVVAKKTLLKRALKEAGVDIDTDAFGGSVLTSVGLRDEVAPAKILSEFKKDREGIQFLGGILEGRLMDAASVTRLSKLPSKKELLDKVVGSLNAPASGFVNVLAGNLRGLVYTLNAIKESKN